MFRAIISPILRNTRLCFYSFWYKAPTMLPAGDMEEVQLVRCMVGGIPPTRSCKNTV